MWPERVVRGVAGCGDAKIAHSLADGRVHSFDLVSVNSKVTACDIAKVPLAADAVDAVVLSLALMGLVCTPCSSSLACLCACAARPWTTGRVRE